MKMSEERGNMLHGVLLIALFSCAAFYIGDFPWVKSLSFSPMIVGIMLGMLYANSLRNRLPATWVPGILFCSKRVLRLGIVLYGFRLTFQDVLAVGAYLCLIAAAVDGMDWFVGLALPITAAGALVIPLLYWIIRTRRCSLLVSAVLVLMAIGLFAVLTEFLCDEYLKGEWVPGWSMVVLASCAGLSIPLIIVRRVPSLREEARRRFHM